MTVPVQPAATVAPLRDGAHGLEVLLVQRSPALVFAPGAWVFPGGRVDEADHRQGAERAARLAAIREAAEEAGLLLDPDTLVEVAHWTTPPGQPRRFATWFFVADANRCGGVRVDGVEAVDYRWLTPADALAAGRRHDITLIRPTIATLTELQDYPDVASALAGFAGRTIQHHSPVA
ncbi:NUDIX hydrolase [Immundisolibacter sp.]|uniref:NUDIX hydrolase n=1 Tax=Immundisolibacter sp. TaxID=1934948 RepID=UPI003563F24C